jgi:hypothetical protein
MSIVIDATLTIPIDAQRVETFCSWAKFNYMNYTDYLECLKTSSDVHDFVWAEIFSPDTELRTAWLESNEYVGLRSNDANVKRCQLNRKRINAKVRYMKTKLGKIAFQEEILQRRPFARTPSQEQRERQEEERLREQRNFILSYTRSMYSYIWNTILSIDPHGATDRFTLQRFFLRNERRVIIEMLKLPYVDNLYDREEQLRTLIDRLLDEPNTSPVGNIVVPVTPPTTPPRKKVQYTQKEISKEEALLPMLDDCCICMEKHRIHSTIQAPCGHQIGKSCFQEWARKCTHHDVSCPLCRVHCHEVLEMVGREPTVPC